MNYKKIKIRDIKEEAKKWGYTVKLCKETVNDSKVYQLKNESYNYKLCENVLKERFALGELFEV